MNSNNDYIVDFVRRASDIRKGHNQDQILKDAQDVIFKRMASEVINIRRRMIGCAVAEEEGDDHA